MLRITQQSSPAGAKAYYAASDYYREGHELVGTWGGLGAKRLGLEGTVGKRAFDRLCDNEHPTTGERLTARVRDGRTVGYDFTFSVPKSVSVLHALARDDDLLGAFQSAVDETLREIEGEMKTRVRVKGTNTERITGNAVWATFFHFTSRPIDGLPDPQMHAHAFVFNATFDDTEGKWKAGQFRDLKRNAPYFQAAFRVRLANRLQELGYALDRTGDDFEIAGVPGSVVERFSRRTALIEEIAEHRGITDPNEKAALGGATREHKDTTLGWDELRAAWRGLLTDPESEALERVATERRRVRGRRAVTGGEKGAVAHALDHAFELASVVSDCELASHALRYGLGEVTVEGIARELRAQRLLAREVDGQRLVTTSEVLGEEKRLVAFARQGRGKYAPLVGYDRTLARDWLNPAQERAVRHLWESPDRVMLLRGAAGTGKTTLLREAVEGIVACGHRVVVLAPSAEAGRGVLRREGFADADTVARFLRNEPLQQKTRGGVILIDEASLVGARTLGKVFDRAGELDARVILVGDAHQHAAVERGDAFRLLQERAGVPVVEVTDIRRQRGAYRDAVGALAAGRVLDGFDALDRLGWIEELSDGVREQRVAADYIRYSSERNGTGQLKEVLVVSPTHAEGQRITSAIRNELKAAGTLGVEHTFAGWVPAHLTEAERRDARNYAPGDLIQFHTSAPGFKPGQRLIVGEGAAVPVTFADRFQVFRPRELALAVGDRVRVTANGPTKDGAHRLNNGAGYTVAGFTARGDITLDNGWVVDRTWGHLAHGYVVTSHASQGKTVDRVLVVQSEDSFPASSREQFYVSASRAKEGVTVYTSDKAALRDAIRRGDPRMTATDLLRPRTDGIRARLGRHLSFLRRLAAFPELLVPSPARIPVRTLATEVTYDR